MLSFVTNDNVPPAVVMVVKQSIKAHMGLLFYAEKKNMKGIKSEQNCSFKWCTVIYYVKCFPVACVLFNKQYLIWKCHIYL